MSTIMYTLYRMSKLNWIVFIRLFSANKIISIPHVPPPMHACKTQILHFICPFAGASLCVRSFVRSFFWRFSMYTFAIVTILFPSHPTLAKFLTQIYEKNECHHNLCVSACLSVWTHMRNHIIPKETNKKPNHWKFSNLNVFSWNVCSIEKYIDIFSLFGTNLRERGKNGTQTHAAHHYYYVCALERFFPFSFVFFIFS